tara:strand:+ start:66 stop:410 length:345 start_codon:yes stop_codon:yes gene_type:complete
MSTSNRNRKSEYFLEKNKNQRMLQYNVSDFKISNKNPNRGINYGKIKPTSICSNYIDVENYLLGINSVNLEKQFQPFSTSIAILPSVRFFENRKTFLPEPFILEKSNRPNVFRR